MGKLSQKLRILRAESNLRTYEIAEKLGVSSALVSGHMRDEKPYMPSLEMLIKYAEIFKVPLNELIDLVKEDSQPEGEGEELNRKIESEIMTILSEFTDEELERALKLVRYMDRESQQLIFDLIRKLSKTEVRNNE